MGSRAAAFFMLYLHVCIAQLGCTINLVVFIWFYKPGCTLNGRHSVDVTASVMQKHTIYEPQKLN